MSLNEHDQRLFHQYFYEWLGLTVFGVFGVPFGVFVIFIHIFSKTTETKLFQKVLLNAQVCRLVTLCTQTLLCSQIYIGDYTYYFGLFTFVLQIRSEYQFVYMIVVGYFYILSQYLFVITLFVYLIPPSSKFYIINNYQTLVVIVNYILCSPFMIQQIVTEKWPVTRPSIYAKLEFATEDLLFYHTYAIIYHFTVIIIMTYFYKPNPNLSIHTQKVQRLYIKISIAMMVVPMVFSNCLTISVSHLISSKQSFLLGFTHAVSNLHLIVSDVMLLIFIKPLRDYARSLFCKLQIKRNTVRKRLSKLQFSKNDSKVFVL